jgi:hypothetical protein
MKHISGRRKLVPFAGLTTGRYRQLRVTEGEPSLGFVTEKTLPLEENYYQLVTYGEGEISERYWQVAPAGIITGISIFRNDSIIGTGNSINKLNFLGVAITATATDFSTISTITVAPPGNDTEILFKDAGDFATSSAFTFDDATDTFRVGITGDILTSSPSLFSVGVGGSVITALSSRRVGFNSINPEQTVDINGSLKLSGRLYDVLNRPGNNTDLITRVDDAGVDGIEWIARTSFLSGAAGTTGSIQFKGTDGLLDGVVEFIYDRSNIFVGIGSTVPRARLDILSDDGSTILIGDPPDTRSATDSGIKFISTYSSPIESGLFTEHEGKLISFGSNVDQIGISTTSRVGGLARIDVRTQAEGSLFGNYSGFIVKGVSIGDTYGDEYNAQVIDLNTGDTFLSPEKGAVAIGTNVVSQKLNIAGYGRTDNGIRIGDVHLFAFSDSNPNTKGSPTFKNLSSPNGHTVLRVIPTGTGNAQIECFTQDYYDDTEAWDNFRIYTTPTYVRLDTSSGTTGTPKDISIETNVSASGTVRSNPGQVYLKTDGNVGINTEDPQYTLDVNGDLEVSGKFVAGDGTSGLGNYVLESTEISTKWSNLADLVVGKSEKTNTLKTLGISSDNTYYPTFVIADNPPSLTGGEEYESVYTSENFKINPHSTVLGSSTFTFEGKSIIGNESNNANINSIADPTVALGPNAYRALNIVDSNATIKIARLTDTDTRDASVDLQVRSADGSSTRALWDIYGGVYGLGSRNNLPGNERTGFFISTEGNFLIGSTKTTPELIASDVSLYGSSNILQVLGDSYLDGNVGIGTSILSDKLRVEGDAYVTGAFKDSGGSPGAVGQILQSNATSTQWVSLGGIAVGTANSLANPQDFQISGDGTAGPIPFNGTAGVNLNFTLGNSGVSSNTYGSNTQVPVFDVNSQGRITSVTDIPINFADAIVGSANSIRTVQSSTDSEHFLTFVDSNNTTADYEALYTDASIRYNPASNTLKLPNGTATSTSVAALWLNGGTGALLIDGAGQKRISWNDGGGNLNFRSGSYNNSGEKYVAAGDGAALLRLNSDGISGSFDVRVAGVGINSNDPITYTAGVGLNTTSFRPITTGLDLGRSSNRWNNVYAANLDVLGTITVTDRIIGIADTAEKLGIGSTATNNTVYYPSFVKNTGSRTNQYFYTDPGFRIRQYNGANQVELFVDGNLIAGDGSGSVGLTVDDGYGDSNVTFNHRFGIPDRNGNAARISFNADDTSNSKLLFQVRDNVTAGTPVALTSIAYISPTVGVSTGGFFPEVSDTYRLGSSSHRWKDVYAQSFNGQFVGTADTAKQIQVEEQTSDNNYFLTFVDSNNTLGVEEEFLYTNSNISFNIPNNRLNVNALGVTNAISGGSLTISGNTNLNGNTTFGDSTDDRLTFTAKVNSNFIPNGTQNIGGTGTNERWGTIYANTFDGNVTGTAGISTRVETIRKNNSNNIDYITFVDTNPDTSTAQNLNTSSYLYFIPNTNASLRRLTVDANLTVTGNTIIGNATTDTVRFNARPDSSIIPSADNSFDLGSTTNRWGIIYANTFVGNVTGTSGISTRVNTQERTGGDNFLIFVDSNNTAAGPELLYTNANIKYNVDTNTLTSTNATFSGNLTVSGNTILGDETTDTVTFTARPDSSIIPSADNLDLGSSGNRWGTIYANTFDGNITGNVTGNVTGSAGSISGASIGFSGGDVTSAAQTFDGTTNLSYNLQLENIISPAPSGTYGDSTTVPTLQVDAKGRVTSIGSAAISFPADLTTTIDYSNVRVIGTNGSVTYGQNNELVIFTGNNGRYTLPNAATSQVGTRITFKLYSGSNCAILRNGALINGLAQNLFVDVIPSSFNLVRVDISGTGTNEWITI